MRVTGTNGESSIRGTLCAPRTRTHRLAAYTPAETPGPFHHALEPRATRDEVAVVKSHRCVPDWPGVVADAWSGVDRGAIEPANTDDEACGKRDDYASA
jgi:hypothetical protein